MAGEPTPAPFRAAGRGWTLSVSATLALLLFGTRLWREPPAPAPSEARWALSPQECTTACQSDQTDCILDCEGDVKCEAGCTQLGGACVERCRNPSLDAGARD